MSKTTLFNDQQRQPVQIVEDQHKYDISNLRKEFITAQPVNQTVDPVATDAMRLANALNENQPGMTKLLDRMAKEQEDKDLTLGQSASRGAGRQSQEDAAAAVAGQSKKYAEGYMTLQGHLAGLQDKTQMAMDWDAVPNKDTTDFQTWSSNWWKNQTAGLSNPHFLAGYNPVMGAAMDQTNQADAKLKVDEQHLRTDASVKETLRSALLEAGKTDSPVPLDMPKYESIRATLGNMVGRNNIQVNALFAETLAEMAKTAQTPEDVTAVAAGANLLKQKHTDGTPGFAKYSGSAQELVTQAERSVLQNYEVTRKNDEITREKARESFMFDVSQMIVSGDTDGGMALIKEKMADPKASTYFNAAEMLNTYNHLRTVAHKEESEQQKYVALSHLPNAYDGNLTYDDVGNLVKNDEIGMSGAQALYSAINTYRSQSRAERKAQTTQDKQALNLALPDAYKVIDTIPISADPMDFGKESYRMARMAKATIRSQVAHAVTTGEVDASTVYKFTTELVDRAKSGLEGANAGHNVTYFTTHPFRYATKEEVQAAYQAGRVTPEELRAYAEYFKPLPAKPTKAK